MKSYKQRNVKLDINMPRSADEAFTDSWVRNAMFHHSTGPEKLAAYEIAWPTFAKLSLRERIEECAGKDGERIFEFRQMCEQSELATQKQGYHVFSISYPQYVEILMTKNMQKLNECMKSGGGFVCKVAFQVMTGGSFEAYLDSQGREAHSFIGACKILLTLRQDDERICYMHRKKPLLNDAQVDALSSVAGGKDAVQYLKSPQVQQFLSNPLNDPTQLSDILDTLHLENPAMANMLKAQLEITCAHCKNQRPGMPVCSRCGKVRYCASACQKEHWPIHKQVCKKK